MNEDSNITHQRAVDLYTLGDEIHPPFERAKARSEDIRKALEDGILFEELVRPEIPNAMLKAVEDSLVNLLGEDGETPANMVDSSLAENMYSSISEAIENALNSEQFINQLGLKIAQKEVAREYEHLHGFGE